MKRLLIIVGALFCLAAAPDPTETLPDPAQEQIARQIFKEVRCVVCQSESIDDSHAELAHDMRQMIRGQVAEGRTKAEVKAFLISRYGDYILLKPRLTPATAILWFGPFLILIGGIAWLIVRRRRPQPLETPLSAEEEARLAAVMSDKNGV